MIIINHLSACLGRVRMGACGWVVGGAEIYETIPLLGVMNRNFLD